MQNFGTWPHLDLLLSAVPLASFLYIVCLVGWNTWKQKPKTTGSKLPDLMNGPTVTGSENEKIAWNYITRGRGSSIGGPGPVGDGGIK